MNRSGISITFTARHLDAIMDEGWHQHDFTVWALRGAEPWSDGRSPREALKALLDAIAPEAWDGVRDLPPAMWTNEAIAAAVFTLANVVEVWVIRDGFGAFFDTPPPP